MNICAREVINPLQKYGEPKCSTIIQMTVKHPTIMTYSHDDVNFPLEVAWA